jgi:hypothetical protein
MKRYIISWLAVMLLMISATTATARELNIAGPWILDYPQGKGMLILTMMGDTYTGELTIPRPKSGGSFVFRVNMLTHRSYLIPGQTISFSTGDGGDFFLNLSSESAGVGWLTPGSENAELQSLFGIKVPAHR